MPRATWNDALFADSEDTVVVEGNHHFPPDSIDRRHVSASDTETVCPWKGVARCYHVTVDGTVNRDAAWYYAEAGGGANP